MERPRNHLQVVKHEKTLLPIEEELLALVKASVEQKIGSKISQCLKHYVHPIYDCYLIVSENKPYLLKINLSPDMPNFWQDLWSNNFSFHPKIICHSSESDEFNYICFEIPSGRFLSDISNYPLSPKLNLHRAFAKSIDQMHSVKLEAGDNTINTFNSLLPRESMMVFKTYPVVDLCASAKTVSRQEYKDNIEHCGLAHFDLSLDKIIYTGNDFKFINFEYAANANIYLDIWLAKQTLNCSDSVFDSFIDLLPKEKTKVLYQYKEQSRLFNFAYFNSKIISEYITFGIKNPSKLKYWINQSESCYEDISNKLFVSKTLDKLIRDFYYLWK